ncbi:MAG: alpha/beta fold hydrolase [Rhodocyclales bacterium]|nr:alpha/beta fold hydrolase [Rhodocyclales bacterium]
MDASSLLLAALAAALLATPALFHAALRRSLTPRRRSDGGEPEGVALPAQAIALPGANGKRLFAWYIPAAAGGGAAPCAVLLHGWGGNAGDLLPLAVPLHAAGYSLLLLDARNHGRSDADSFASMPRFAEDLDCAIDWLRRQPACDPARLAVIGHSVGAAAALLAASRRSDIAAVVSIAAFAHPASVMRRFLAARRIPFIPLGWYALRYVERVIGHRFDAIAPEHTIRRVSCPVLLVHGSEDRTVPPADAHHLAQCAGGRAQLLLLRGDHEAFADPAAGIAAVRTFLAATLPYTPLKHASTT